MITTLRRPCQLHHHDHENSMDHFDSWLTCLFVINAGFVRRMYSESLGQQACVLNASSHCKADSLLLTTETVDLLCHLKCHQQLRRNFDRGCLSLPSLLHHLCKGLSCSWTLQPNGQLQIKPQCFTPFGMCYLCTIMAQCMFASQLCIEVYYKVCHRSPQMAKRMPDTCSGKAVPGSFPTVRASLGRAAKKARSR